MTDQKQLKTGTTTLGIVCKEGIVMAADMKMTAGYFIAGKDFDKIVPINDRIALTVAGYVSEAQMMVKVIRAQINLEELKRGRELKIVEVANLIRNLIYGNSRRYSPFIAAFLMAGRDRNGYHLYDLSPDASVTEHKDYATSGSGSMFALSIIEAEHKPSISLAEAKKLASKAIGAAIKRDAASGGGINIITITKDGVNKVLSESLDDILPSNK
jgi:proteasome beta subunit